MPSDFAQHLRAVKLGYGRLLRCRPVPINEVPRETPSHAIYLLRENGVPIYVGRTNNLRARLRGHCSGKHEKAALAFRLAREETNRRATYKKAGSRAALVRDRAFADAFRRQSERVRRMTVQYVVEPDPIRQTLLEVYAATTLATAHNSFENH